MERILAVIFSQRADNRLTAIVDVVRDKFGLASMVMAGDRGMITSARIAALLAPHRPRPGRPAGRRRGDRRRSGHTWSLQQLPSWR